MTAVGPVIKHNCFVCKSALLELKLPMVQVHLTAENSSLDSLGSKFGALILEPPQFGQACAFRRVVEQLAHTMKMTTICGKQPGNLLQFRMPPSNQMILQIQ